MTKVHYADAAYQRERRRKIKSGELTPKPKSRKREGLTSALRTGKPWIEVFQTRSEANEFQRSVASIGARENKKIRSKTYVSVDPDTDQAVFIVESKMEKRDENQ